MKTILRNISAISFFLLVYTTAQAQVMYPGDVSNNGEVNMLDVLYAGSIWGLTGPVRTDAETEWAPQNITSLWAGDFANGTNHAYADCDGNGVINNDDIDVVADNFGRTHGTVLPDENLTGVEGTDPGLSLRKTSGATTPGDQVDFSIELGSETLPVNNFYGVAFTLRFDSTLFDNIDFDLQLDTESWISSSSGGLVFSGSKSSSASRIPSARPPTTS
ncbi:MAG: hypothetical protein AAFO94_22765, partial [Bacteroidota bacterium]